MRIKEGTVKGKENEEEKFDCLMSSEREGAVDGCMKLRKMESIHLKTDNR